ncbi:MAG: RagB/SusD family nutrient uptake outer membrane protein [Marinifilaceae bacterium]
MKKYILALFASLTLCTSCEDWLKVQPSDRITEDQLFTSAYGFKTALNGVYLELNATELYGRTLMCEFIDILAQSYLINSEAITYSLYFNHEYTASSVKSKLDGIWKKSYSLIANLNLILRNCELNGTILSTSQYNTIKGEALALRAYLHFDLYRLFGTCYVGNENMKAIPYCKEFSLNVQPTLAAKEYMAQVLADLREAKELLTDDPVKNNGVAGDSYDEFMQARNLRMNYYAICGLLARAELYCGNKEAALQEALEVIEIQPTIFPFVELKDISADNAAPDRVFSSELLFALQNTNRSGLYTSLFEGLVLKMNNLLAPASKTTDQLYDYEKEDYRYQTWLKGTVEQGGREYNIFSKYMKIDESSDPVSHASLLPMIRISEMYYIAAECSETNKIKFQYLNEMRKARNVSAHNRLINFDSHLTNEYQREFLGEGQLFFHYKRLNMKSIPSALSYYSNINMNDRTYQMPLPDSETMYN